MKKSYIVFVAFHIACLLVSGTNLHAQTVPPGQEAGPQAQRLREDIERRKAIFEEKKAGPAPWVPEEAAQPAMLSKVFLLRNIKITGMTLFTSDQLRPLYQPLLGKEVVLADIQNIADSVKARYKAKGYLTTMAFIPEQEIKDGAVEISVMEGKMGDLKVEGNRWVRADIIRGYFHTQKNDLLNIPRLESDILRMNQDPDLEVRARLMEGAAPQTSDITLTTRDRYPYHIGMGVDNQGTRLAGKEREMFTLRSTNITGHDDDGFASFMLGKSSHAQSVNYRYPLDTNGTRIGLSLSHYNLKLAKEFKEFDMTGDTKVMSPYISKGLFLSGDAQVDFNTGLDIMSVKKHHSGQLSANDQLRVPYLGMDFTKIDPLGQTTFSPRADFGLSGLMGASSEDHPSASRRGTGGRFFKYGQTITRSQQMFCDSYAVIRGQIQATADALAPSEQLQIGGVNSVRGYPEGDYLADKGMILNIDWIFPMYVFPPAWRLPHADMPLRHQIEPVIFFDWGEGRLNRVLPGESRAKTLAGVGGGVRMRLYKNLFARFEWAKDIGDKPVSGAGPATFIFSVQSEL